ncbi:MAG: FHA domain-containing protein, partial [Frankia sp.]|nr:FHA domain-containing protein [Frankia sp.]
DRGSYGAGQARGGGGYDAPGVGRGGAADPVRGGGRGGYGADPYGGDRYGGGADRGDPYGGGAGYGSGGYDDDRTARPSYGSGSYDQGGYGGGQRDTGGYPPRGRDAAEPGGYGGRPGEDFGGRDGYGAAHGARDDYARPGREDSSTGGYGARGREGYDTGPGYAGGRGTRDDYGRPGPYGREGDDLGGAGYGGGRGSRDDYPAGRDRGYGGYDSDPLGVGGRVGVADRERDRDDDRGLGGPRGGDRGERLDRGAPRYGQCPNCRAYHEPGARFCESCGLDFTTGHLPTGAGERGGAPGGGRRHSNPPVDDGRYGEPVISGSANGWGGQPAGTVQWEAVVEAEREYYDSGDDHRVPFPAFYPRRVFPLTGSRMLVGRRSESRGIHPEIDLSGAPEDPGISRAHAILERQPDGSYALLDPGSTNGTRINDEPDPIEPHGPVPLRDGDRIYLGAWTRITVRAR